MKTRKEVAAFILKQIDCIDQPAIPDKKLGNWNYSTGNGNKDKWHYGKCELRQLMDFMYGCPPEPGDELK